MPFEEKLGECAINFEGTEKETMTSVIMATTNKTVKERKVHEVLARYGITDRRVAVTARGVMVYVPAECLGGCYDGMYGDIKDALDDGKHCSVRSLFQGAAEIILR